MPELCLYMSEFTITYRVLNIYHTIISARSPYKLMSTYWFISDSGQRSTIERLGKIIIVFKYFCKELHIKSLRGFWIYVGFYNVRVLWIFVNFRKYDRVLNILRDVIIRVLNIPEFQICQVSEYASAAQGFEYAWIMPYDKILNMLVNVSQGFK